MVKVTNRDKRPLTPAELGDLYPTPKTYDEIQEDTEKRQELLKTYRTKMPAFKIAFFGSALVAAIAVYATNVEILWLIGGQVAIVFGIAIWVILFLFTIKWLHYTVAIFYEYSSPGIAFWLLYATVMGATIVAWKYGFKLSSANHIWLVILPGVQFVSTYILAKIFVKRMK